MIINIKNWEKYNPKRDQTTYSWLRLNNDIYMDQHLFDLSAGQKFGWVVILCLASKKNEGKVDLGDSPIDFLCHCTQLSKKDIAQLLEKIKEKGLILLY